MKKSKRRRPNRAGKRPAGAARRWSQQRRLELIDFRLRWAGQVNRSDLTSFFGISVPQASLDIASYVELAPRNLEYDRASRAYLATPEFRALYATSGSQPFLDELLAGAAVDEPGGSRLGSRPPVEVVPSPGRRVPADVLATVQQAIRTQQGLSVTYQSLTRPEPTRRVLSPHAFVFDGQRWHVRAYCHAQAAFRDFVIGRILEVHGLAPAGLGPDRDTRWNTLLRLVLAPHPELPPAQRRAIELDYDMRGGQAVLECREALLFYVLERLGLRRGAGAAGIAPEAQQIVLVNAGELERYWEDDARRVA